MRSDRRLDCAPEREAPTGSGFGEAAVGVIEDALARNVSRIEPGMLMRAVVTFNIREAGQHVALERAWETHRQLEGRFFPSRALDWQQEGRVLTICTIQADRTLDCAVAEETPTGFGFGEAAIRLKESSRVTESAFGQPGLSADRLRDVVNFRIED